MMKGKRAPTISAAEVISENDDLLLEILVILPAKSLIRFKSVSRRWLSLISDASFRHLHTRRHRSPQACFLLRASPSQFYRFNPTSKNLVPFNFNFDEEALILQSCNGLLLVQRGYPHIENYYHYYVYNPTTGESRNLLLRTYIFSDLFMAFDPLKSPHNKVFCVRFAETLWHYDIEVYDSETYEWKRYERLFPIPKHPPLRNWVYSHSFNFSLHFDIEKLEFRKHNFFSYQGFGLVQSSIDVLCIMESFGHVHRISRDIIRNYLVVDEMMIAKNGKLSFKTLFEFDITPCCPDKKISFLGIIRGNKKDESLFFHIPGKIMAYRFHQRTFEEILDYNMDDDRLPFTNKDSCQFVESLAPV